MNICLKKARFCICYSEHCANSLYTNIPIDETIDLILGKIYISADVLNCNIKNQFKKLLCHLKIPILN